MATSRLSRSRWWWVAVAALLMGVAGGYQFLWSSLRGPLGESVRASEPALGSVFTLFVVTLTVAQFPAGWVRDRWGPRLPLLAAAPLLAGGFVGAALSTSPTELALFYMLGGAGAGAAYTVAVNTPVKWFDERRGVATGIVVMAFGGLSFLLIPTVRGTVDSNLDGTLLGLGLLAGLVALAAAVLLRDPDAGADGGDETGGEIGSESDDSGVYTWRDTLRTWQFWLLYAVFIVINGIGVMVIGKAVAFAQALDLTAAVATGSASLIAISDAAGVFVGSSASDRYGRERTAGAALGLTGIGLAGAVAAGAMESGFAFVVLLGVAAFFRSPAFAIFPVLVGEYYGEQHSSTNYAALYTAKIWGALFGGAVASSLVVGLGWAATFLLAAGVAVIGGVATLLLRPPKGVARSQKGS